MFRFYEIFPETGVDAVNNFMVVGLRGSNLVALQAFNDVFDLRYDSKRLEVIKVTRENVTQVTNILYRQFVIWGLADEDSTKAYWGAMQATLNSGIHTRLFLVTGKVPGSTTMSAVSNRIKISIKVDVLAPKSFNVALKFLQLRDDSGVMDQTQYAPSDAPWLIRKLNWIYGPQANISFRLAGANWVKVDVAANVVKIKEALTGSAFSRYVVGLKDKQADGTIFFVRNYVSTDGIGNAETFSDEKVCVVCDQPAAKTPVIPGEDPFLVTFAHEVAHFLAFDETSPVVKQIHHYRPNILMSKLIESARVDMNLVEVINPP